MSSQPHVISPASWPDLVASALVGTDRRPLPGPDGDPATGLLDQAAARIVPAFAGRRPETPAAPAATPPGIEPAPHDARPPIGESAALRLRVVIDSHAAYLPDWLAAAQAGGYRIPAALHAELLDLGRTNTQIRPGLALVLGARGRWLAGLNGSWRYLLREPREDAESAHRTDPDPDVRLSYAAGVFQRDPAEGRRLLREAWPTERVPVRLGLLALLARAAGPQDLEFLDSLTKDPSKQVRRDAEQLVAAVRRRVDEPRATEAADFTTMVKHLLVLHGLGREVYNLTVVQPGAWPEEGSRLLIDQLAVPESTSTTNRHPAWVRNQIASFLGEHAPITLRGHVARLVAEQTAIAAASDGDLDGDLGQVLYALDFRIALLAELARPAADTPDTTDFDPTALKETS